MKYTKKDLKTLKDVTGGLDFGSPRFGKQAGHILRHLETIWTGYETHSLGTAKHYREQFKDEERAATIEETAKRHGKKAAEFRTLREKLEALGVPAEAHQ